jgi:hypothetical protein
MVILIVLTAGLSWDPSFSSLIFECCEPCLVASSSAYSLELTHGIQVLSTLCSWTRTCATLSLFFPPSINYVSLFMYHVCPFLFAFLLLFILVRLALAHMEAILPPDLCASSQLRTESPTLCNDGLFVLNLSPHMCDRMARLMEPRSEVIYVVGWWLLKCKQDCLKGETLLSEMIKFVCTPPTDSSQIDIFGLLCHIA